MPVLEQHPSNPSTKLAHLLSSSGSTSFSSLDFAHYLDREDPIQSTTSDLFHFPSESTIAQRNTAAEAENEVSPEKGVYLAGNSLGLMPKQTSELVQQELHAWQTQGVMGHVEHPYGRPWVQIDEIVTSTLAEIVGAKPSEVACMGSLTSNIHILFTSFYRPTQKRHKIMYEANAFPSDQYAFASQVELHDFSPASLLPISPRPNEYNIRTEDILQIIEEQGEEISIVCFGAIQYYSGQFFDLEKITKKGHEKGCLVAFDCAHAVGNVPLKLHEWDVDFAAWCSYKYLNAGPGGIAGLYVHERWADKKRLAGWWGHDSSTRFQMPNHFLPNPGTAGWQLSNPSVLDVISLYSSLEIFKAVGQVIPPSRLAGGHGTIKGPILGSLREKSQLLTMYLEILLKGSSYYVDVASLKSSSTSKKVLFTIITPLNPAERGSQLSLLFEPVESMDPIFDNLRKKGVLGDERRPGVIRLAPVALYNGFEDVWKAAQALENACREYDNEQK